MDFARFLGGQLTDLVAVMNLVSDWATRGLISSRSGLFLVVGRQAYRVGNSACLPVRFARQAGLATGSSFAGRELPRSGLIARLLEFAPVGDLGPDVPICHGRRGSGFLEGQGEG